MQRGPKRGHFSRSRPLEKFNKKFGRNLVENEIRNLLKINNNVRVLEIGCGEGRVLMQLRKLFPNIELHGINKGPWLAMQGSKSLIKTSLYYKIFSSKQLKNISLPQIHFYDAKKLKFKSNYFDLIISQTSIPYIERKDLVLEEIWRVLKLNGKAFLHMDICEKQYPDFMQYESPRFLIYKNDKLIELKDLVKDWNKEGFNIKYRSFYSNKKGRCLIFIKNTNKSLKMNLEFDPTSSFNLNKIDKDRIDIFWGYRSVFILK